MKICLITDLHIDQPGELIFGLDTRAQLVQILRSIPGHKYDYMIIAGDLCHKTGIAEIYEWIKCELDNTNIPYSVISGNHDTSVLIAEIFGNHDLVYENELFYVKKMNAGSIIFLDTSMAMMSDHQYKWLNEKIEESEEHVIICMHHPPLRSNSKHMEPKYMFTQMERFERLCVGFPDKLFYVFCGHYHMERTIIKGNIHVFITPSTFVQIDPDLETFKPLNQLIGYREIIIEDQRLLYSGVIYI